MPITRKSRRVYLPNYLLQTTSASRSEICAGTWRNPANYLWRDWLPVRQSWITTHRSSQALTHPRIRNNNKWMKSYYTPSQTPGPSRRTYKGGILNPRDTGIPTRCSSRWKPWNKSMKGEHLLKATKTGHIPAVLSIAGHVNEEDVVTMNSQA